MVSGKREKKSKKTNQRKRRQRITERWQGSGVRERGEGKDAPQSVARKGWGGVVSQKMGEGGW